MYTQEIERENWSQWLEVVSQQSASSQVFLETIGLDIGDQIEEEWTRIKRIYFDANEDRCCVSTENVDHFIRHPARIQAVAEGSKISAIQIEDHSGNKQIIRLRQPLLIGP
jgi:hypothetical protein